VDYLIAATAAAFPWLFCCFYFIFVMADPQLRTNWETWKEILLASRFAAPTSAGVLFSMLAAAGLAGTWMFHKARILAIFDDLDTVLFMIPLEMMMVGFHWQLAIIVSIIVALLWLAWKDLHHLRIPISWPWVLLYSACLGLACESIYLLSKRINELVPVHVEVLLPAFVVGCLISRMQFTTTNNTNTPQAKEDEEEEEGTHFLETLSEQYASTIVSACFMALVGLSMPPMSDLAVTKHNMPITDSVTDTYIVETPQNANTMLPPSTETQPVKTPLFDWPILALHVLVITLVSNLGKMFILFCYRKETHWRNRLAVCIAMFPRGEVGAGVLAIALAYGIGGPIIIVAMFSLALNLLLTGLFIIVVKYLIEQSDDHPTAAPATIGTH